MKLFQNKKRLLLTADILLLPGLFLCELLSDLMLSTSSECAWVTIGGKCITCGGTHFVNTLLNGHFSQAYHHNEFLFVLCIFLLFAYIVLHLNWLAQLQWAKTLTRRIFSIPTLVVGLCVMFIFFIERNIPVFAHIWQLLSAR